MAKNKRITTAMVGELIGVGTSCVQKNMQEGNLPIGFYSPGAEGERGYYFISPLKLMMFTGIKKEAIEKKCGIDLSDYMDIEDYQVMKGALDKWKELIFGEVRV